MFDLPKYEQTRESMLLFSSTFFSSLHSTYKRIFLFIHTVIRTDEHIAAAFNVLREHVDKTLKRSAFQNVKLSDIFRKMMPAQNKPTNGIALTA